MDSKDNKILNQEQMNKAYQKATGMKVIPPSAPTQGKTEFAKDQKGFAKDQKGSK